jgi:Phosphate-induced protein 1 conserved region
VKYLCLVTILSCAIFSASAQTARNATHLVPNGKGWGEIIPGQQPPGAGAVKKGPTTNNIYYHGGPVMTGTVNLYFIWYGNFVSGPAKSDSLTTQDLLADLFGQGGLGGTPYARINTTYNDKGHAVTGNFALTESVFDYYSYGTSLSDATVASVVGNAIGNHALPRDSNGIYFVLASSDVNETSGFCTHYCGWHGRSTIEGVDIKIAFVGNPDRCPSACEEQIDSPNGDSGADAMAATMALETNKVINDPDLNAWYDTNGNESSDKCAWKWGPVEGTIGQRAYNVTVAGHDWLLPMNWENARGGGCDLELGGKFYGQ